MLLGYFVVSSAGVSNKQPDEKRVIYYCTIYVAQCRNMAAALNLANDIIVTLSISLFIYYARLYHKLKHSQNMYN